MKQEKPRKIAVIIGTRPEVIKTASTIKGLQRHPKKFSVVLISTGQHDELFKQAMLVFNLKANYNLRIMTKNQTLFDIAKRVLEGIEAIFLKEKFDLVIVQGDTLSAFIGSLSAFFLNIPIAHIESGDRSYKKYDPFPEEMNRQLIDRLSDIYFARTKEQKKNLIHEGMPKDKIWITGSTSVDAASYVLKKTFKFSDEKLAKIDFVNKRIILLTMHRREAWGESMKNVLEGLKKAVDEIEGVEVIFPVHLNKKVSEVANNVLKNDPKFHLLNPISYQDLILVLKQCYFTATDSGGICEEAAYFRIPILALRNISEKEELIKLGKLKVTTTDKSSVYITVKKLLEDREEYRKMSSSKNPYGQGVAYKKITQIIRNFL